MGGEENIHLICTKLDRIGVSYITIYAILVSLSKAPKFRHAIN